VPVAAVALVLGSCGGGDAGTTTSPATGTAPATASTAPARDAGAVVDRAFRALLAGSYRAEVENTSELTAEGAPEQVRDALARADTDTSSSVEAESAGRARSTSELAGGLGELQIVLFDGTLFVSKDGTDWRELAGDLKAYFDQAFALSRLDVSELAGDFRADGGADVEGVATDRYVGQIDPARYREIAGPLLQGLGPVAGAVEFTGGTIEVLVARDDGRLMRQVVNLDLSLDLGEIGSQGTVDIRSASTYTVRDHGAPVTVERPTASGTLATLAELGQFVQ
jgi:hypothetical protein